MHWKKIGKKLLFPHRALLLVLLPFAAAFLVYVLLFLGTESPAAILSYILAAYTLTILCMRIPCLIRYLRHLWDENRFAQRWQRDTGLRINVSLYSALVWNTAYAVFQLGLGFWHHTFWFLSLAAYYLSLAVMRMVLVRYTSRHEPGEEIRTELFIYRACGIVFLVMNLALSLMIFFMVYWNRTFHHHEIITIAMAAYTFTSLALAIRNTVRSHDHSSPVYSASKAISLASACVSMLTLESTMLTTFGEDTMALQSRRILLGASGAVLSAFVITMAVWMIVHGTKTIQLMREDKEK